MRDYNQRFGKLYNDYKYRKIYHGIHHGTIPNPI